MEQYGRRAYVRIYNVPVESEEIVDSVYEKTGEFLKEACPDVPVPLIDGAHHVGSEYRSCNIYIYIYIYIYKQKKYKKEIKGNVAAP